MVAGDAEAEARATAAERVADRGVSPSLIASTLLQHGRRPLQLVLPLRESVSKWGQGGRRVRVAGYPGALFPTWRYPMPLRFKLQLVVVADDGVTATEDLIFLDKEHERLEQLGLTLAEGKQLLREVQRRVLERQVKTFLATQAVCPDCGRERGTKDHKTLGLRTLFGKV